MADRFDLINISKSITTTTGGTTANVNIDANTLFVDGTNNRVGIGTITPQAATVVSNAGAAGLEFFTNYPGGGVGTYIQSFNRSTTAYVNTAYDAADHSFRINGTERMRIDASGRVTMYAQPSFYARGAAQNLVLGNQGDLVLGTAAYNIGGHYNTSTYRFTAPVAGRYLFTWSVFVNTVAGRCALKLNGSAYNDLQMDVGAGLSQAAILNLSASDFVSVGDWQNISGLNYWGSHSHFSGILLG